VQGDFWAPDQFSQLIVVLHAKASFRRETFLMEFASLIYK